MMTPGNTSQKPSPVRQPVLLGLFTGTAVGAGFLLAGVPNVELMTLVIALCGGSLGWRSGLTAGCLAATVYSLGSPYGLPVPVMLLAQAVGLGCAGLLGAIVGNRVLSCHYKERRTLALLWAVVTGLGSTLIYDLLTNLAIIGAFDMNATVVMAGAVPFVLLHLASNAVIFAGLMPLLLPRLAGLKRSGLVARNLVPIILLVAVLGAPLSAEAQQAEAQQAEAQQVEVQSVAAPADTVAAAPEPEKEANPLGWQRPLWTPFAQSNLEWLGWNSRYIPVIDGGLGAPVMILGEAGTSAHPLFERDGIPVGTGHILADSPWLTPTVGLVVHGAAGGNDGWGSTGGLIALQTEDPDPEKAVSGYRGVKGKHESYYRSIYLLTPKASWRAAFEFEESLDIEGYNFTESEDLDFVGLSGIEFPGHSRVRQSRTRLFREFDPDNRLIVEFTNGRLTKDELPVYDAEHLELWADGLAATMQARLGAWRLDSKVFWQNRDVIWGDRSITAEVGEDLRLLETGREGISLNLFKPHNDRTVKTGITLQGNSWYVNDSLINDTWLSDFGASGDGDGQSGRAVGQTGLALGKTLVVVGAGTEWHSYAGLGPEAFLKFRAAGDQPWWGLNASYGGRAPRSDELLTPLRRDVAGRKLTLLPNLALDREKTARLALNLKARLFGFDLAVEGSVSRLQDGITWRALPNESLPNETLPDESNIGRWHNDLEMLSNRITGSIGRQGRFLGWGRAMLEGTWQDSDETEGQAAFLPPKRYLRSHLMWENHLFKEDGILQLALMSTIQGAMDDPWDVTRTAQLPSRTVHDLLVGFRLLGAHLGLGLRNLTNERAVLTSGARSAGQETTMRLHWNWLY